MGWAKGEEEESHTAEFFRELVDLDAYSPRNRSKEMYRVVASYPLGHIRGGPNVAPKPERNDDLFARHPGLEPTWQVVQDHLRWQHLPSTFISFFTKYDMAIRWKNNFIREGAYRVYIFCYTTKHVPHLLDANELARELSLHTLENVGKRHYHEYLVMDRISGKDCMGYLSSPADESSANDWTIRADCELRWVHMAGRDDVEAANDGIRVLLEQQCPKWYRSSIGRPTALVEEKFVSIAHVDSGWL